MSNLDIASSRDVKAWVEFLSHAEIPVLKHTAREMAKLQADEDSLNVRAVTQTVIQDPMMTFRLLRYSQSHKHQHQLQDLVLVEQAIMMMGMTTFFSKLPPIPVVEDILKPKLQALMRLLKMINRAHRAAKHALDWAALLYDLHAEEIVVATLLHDLSEMLLCCFAPDRMLQIAQMQAANKALRSHDVQLEVLGFQVHELQLALVEACNLPPLLSALMHEENQLDRRVQNVTIAVNFARHSANGWDDAALPDDYKAIAQLLRVDVEKAKRLVGAP
jgi:HD-like signal output (HDOD) protein